MIERAVAELQRRKYRSSGRCDGIFGRTDKEIEEIDTAGVEIHPTAGREWSAKGVLDDLDLKLADSENNDAKLAGRGAISILIFSADP